MRTVPCPRAFPAPTRRLRPGVAAVAPARITTPPPVTTTPHVQWPEGKTFAFSVVDDTDRSTLENAPPVYDLLMRLGFRTTKTVWTLRGSHGEDDGATCENRQYLDWARWLARNGFEIAMHNA